MKGSLPALTSVSPAMKVGLAEWTDKEIAVWHAVLVVTLNLRPIIRYENRGPVKLDAAIAGREVVLFGKRLDKAVHGRLVQRFNRRIPRIPFLEFGESRGWHCHMLIEPPYAKGLEDFTRLIEISWSQSPWSTSVHIRIGDEGSRGYLTKQRSKAALEAWTDTLITDAVVLRARTS